MSDEKKEDFAQQLSILMSFLCDCNIPPENIGHMRFLCDSEMPGVVILQGRIVSNGKQNASDLIGDVEKISQMKSDVLIQNVQLRALDNCSVHLTMLGEEPNCVLKVKDSEELLIIVMVPLGIFGVLFSTMVILLLLYLAK